MAQVVLARVCKHAIAVEHREELGGEEKEEEEEEECIDALAVEPCEELQSGGPAGEIAGQSGCLGAFLTGNFEKWIETVEENCSPSHALLSRRAAAHAVVASGLLSSARPQLCRSRTGRISSRNPQGRNGGNGAAFGLRSSSFSASPCAGTQTEGGAGVGGSGDRGERRGGWRLCGCGGAGRRLSEVVVRGWVCAMRLLQDEDSSVSSPVALALHHQNCWFPWHGRCEAGGEGRGILEEVLGGRGSGDGGGGREEGDSLLGGGGLYSPLALLQAASSVVNLLHRQRVGQEYLWRYLRELVRASSEEARRPSQYLHPLPNLSSAGHAAEGEGGGGDRGQGGGGGGVVMGEGGVLLEEPPYWRGGGDRGARVPYCGRLDTLPCPAVAQTTDTCEGDLQIDPIRSKRDLPCPTAAQTTAAYERESGLALAVFVQLLLEHGGGLGEKETEREEEEGGREEPEGLFKGKAVDEGDGERVEGQVMHEVKQLLKGWAGETDTSVFVCVCLCVCVCVCITHVQSTAQDALSHFFCFCMETGLDVARRWRVLLSLGQATGREEDD